MLIFASRKDVLCQEMKNAYNALVQTSEARKVYAQSWCDFGSTACAMLTSQIPELKKDFEQFRALCTQLSIAYRNLSEGEMRNAEDFRDVIERYAVVYRAFNEMFDAKDKYLSMNEKYQALKEKSKVAAKKPNNENAVSKLNLKVADAKEATIEALKNLINCTETVKTEKGKYNLFKIKRMKQGWVRYTNSLKTASEEEIRIFTQMKELIFRLNVKNPGAARTFETKVQEQLEVPNPEPVHIPEPQENENDEIIQQEEMQSHQPIFDGYE